VEEGLGTLSASSEAVSNANYRSGFTSSYAARSSVPRSMCSQAPSVRPCGRAPGWGAPRRAIRRRADLRHD